jgi:phosphomannomutase
MVRTGKKAIRTAGIRCLVWLARTTMTVLTAPSPRTPVGKFLARVDTARPATIGGLKVTDIVTIDGHQFFMEDGGWLLVRFSGTEPVLRGLL